MLSYPAESNIQRPSQEDYEECFKDMSKLTRKEILLGCKVFEARGVDKVMNSCHCFIGEICDGDSAVVRRTIERDVTMHNLYWMHYLYPELVFLVACELLEDA